MEMVLVCLKIPQARKLKNVFCMMFAVFSLMIVTLFSNP